MLWSGKGETLGLSDFAAVEKHWESQEKGIIQRLSHSRVFRPVTMFVIAGRSPPAGYARRRVIVDTLDGEGATRLQMERG